MSFFIPDHDLERILEEDVHPLDLTSHLLGMDRREGRIRYLPRTPIVLACTEEVERIFLRLGLQVESCLPSGSLCAEGESFFQARGRGDRLHLAWRTGLRVLESYCGIATRTADLVRKARAVNPDISVVTTRKAMPGTRHLAIKAVMAGGAYPHRLGLSETILIFDAHTELLGGEAKLLEAIPRIKREAREKKVGAEAKSLEGALALVRAGVDFVQLDKLPPAELALVAREARLLNPAIVIVAAGNVNLGNVEAYAASGADVLVTSSLYFGPPADIQSEIRSLES